MFGEGPDLVGHFNWIVCERGWQTAEHNQNLLQPSQVALKPYLILLKPQKMLLQTLWFILLYLIILRLSYTVAVFPPSHMSNLIFSFKTVIKTTSESYPNTYKPSEWKQRKNKFNIAGGGILHSPCAALTMERHAGSKNMILSKPASICPPTEPISPCVLGSHREMFIHLTFYAVNGSPNFAFSPSTHSSAPSFIPLFSWLEMKVNHHILTCSVPCIIANTAGGLSAIDWLQNPM